MDSAGGGGDGGDSPDEGSDDRCPSDDGVPEEFQPDQPPVTRSMMEDLDEIPLEAILHCKNSAAHHKITGTMRSAYAELMEGAWDYWGENATGIHSSRGEKAVIIANMIATSRWAEDTKAPSKQLCSARMAEAKRDGLANVFYRLSGYGKAFDYSPFLGVIHDTRPRPEPGEEDSHFATMSVDLPDRQVGLFLIALLFVCFKLSTIIHNGSMNRGKWRKNNSQ